MIFCAGLCVRNVSHSKKTVLFTVASFVVSLLMIYLVGTDISSLSVKIGSAFYVLLTVVTPLVYGFVGGKNKNA